MGPSSWKISLKEGDKPITDFEIANVLNKHFVNIVLCLTEKGGCSAHVFDINDKQDPLNNIVTRFQLNLSIIAIEKKVLKKYLILLYSQPKKFYLKWIN